MNNTPREHSTQSAWISGIKDATPLLGGYIPVAISFGVIAVQTGFSALEAIFISTAIYAGAAQFLFLAMVATGAPLWLLIIMTLLVNARHIVYSPNLAPYLSNQKRWFWLMHGLTDQIFALAQTRLPEIPNEHRASWYMGTMVVAWGSWIGGTAIGAYAGGEITQQWPLLGEALPFAMPALIFVLIAPKFNSLISIATMGSTIVLAIAFKLAGFTSAAIPFAAFAGAAVHFAMSQLPRYQARSLPTEKQGGKHGQ